MPLSTVIRILGFAATLLLYSNNSKAQERPQATGPTVTPERQIEIRDSIRNRSRIKFKEREEAKAKKINYEPDRALLMPAMERSAIFRIGLPGWALRAGLRAGREDFETVEEYEAVRTMMRGLKSIRVAAYANNRAYSSERLLKKYKRYIKRRRHHEPVLIVRAPGGGVQIHVKERLGKVKRIILFAYGNEGAAVIRVKSRFSEKHLKKGISLMTDKADQDLGIEIDTAPH